MANRARNMAGPPFDPWHASFDFCITMDGRREPYTEEFPLYHALVAAGYRMFGEQDWFGRALSGVGSLVAILAFIGLMRREYDDRFALLAGVLFAFCPMLVFYGRTVIPDVWMLACMLACAYFSGVALENNRWTALLASGLAGLLAVAFKYYGLMVLLPMAEMAWRLQGRRGLVRLCLPAAMMSFRRPHGWDWSFFNPPILRKAASTSSSNSRLFSWNPTSGRGWPIASCGRVAGL